MDKANRKQDSVSGKLTPQLIPQSFGTHTMVSFFKSNKSTMKNYYIIYVPKKQTVACLLNRVCLLIASVSFVPWNSSLKSPTSTSNQPRLHSNAKLCFCHLPYTLAVVLYPSFQITGTLIMIKDETTTPLWRFYT